MRRRFRQMSWEGPCRDPESRCGSGWGRACREAWHERSRHAHGPWYGPPWWVEEPEAEEAEAQDLAAYVADLESIVKDLQQELAELKTRFS